MSKHRSFADSWSELPRMERSRIRRSVRMGRPLDNSEQAQLGVEYADFQRSRIWVRMFWVWFVPGVVLALGVAAQAHPVVVGIVIALGAQAVFARRNLGRVRKVNSHLLNG